MCALPMATAAVTFGLLNWLPAPADEVLAFTKAGETITWIRDGGEGRMCAVCIGTVGERVVFVAFVAGLAAGKPFPIPVTTERVYSIGPGNTLVEQGITAYLDLSGGARVRLPLKRQLIEVANGKITFSDRRVTQAEVRAYLDSKPKKCSLDGLIRFTEIRRKARGK
jgi:hypothetical protein